MFSVVTSQVQCTHAVNIEVSIIKLLQQDASLYQVMKVGIVLVTCKRSIIVVAAVQEVLVSQLIVIIPLLVQELIIWVDCTIFHNRGLLWHLIV